MAKEQQYFWNKKGECFAGCKFGEEVTEFLEGQEKRVEELLALGKIVKSRPVDFDSAKENELKALRVEVEKLQERNKELETEAKKSGSAKPSKKVKDLEAEIKDLTAKLESANLEVEGLKTELLKDETKIAELESQVATLTDPKGKK